jgi:hypothetical protein
MSPPRHASDDEMDAATWCRHLAADGSVYAFLVDHRHQLFPPELFADVVRHGGGHPSVPAEVVATVVVATVMVLQALEGLSDREAVSALRRDIAWKVACGLRLDDEGFHPTVLVYWRNRIRRSGRPRRTFEAVREVSEQTGSCRDGVGGCWTPRSWRTRSPPRTPSPSWSRRSVGCAGWCRGHAGSSWPPTTMTVRASPSAPGRSAGHPGAGIGAGQRRAGGAGGGPRTWVGRRAGRGGGALVLVAGQDVEPGQRPGSWRIARQVATDRVISVVDPRPAIRARPTPSGATATRSTSPPSQRPGW